MVQNTKLDYVGYSDIGTARDTARYWVQSYFHDKDFLAAQKLLEEKLSGKSRAQPYNLFGELLSSKIKKFLDLQGIDTGANFSESGLERIVDKSNAEEAAIIGDALQFVSTSVKTYALSEDVDNIHIIHSTFEALKPVSRGYAANFLERVCQLMENKSAQMDVYRAMATLLPYVASLQRKVSPEKYVGYLARFLDYTASAIRKGELPKEEKELVRGFLAYGSNGHASVHEVIRLLGDYNVGDEINRKALAELRNNLGSSVLGLNIRLLDNVPTDILTMVVGSEESPQRVRIKLKKGMPKAFYVGVGGIGSRIPTNQFARDTKITLAAIREHAS